QFLHHGQHESVGTAPPLFPIFNRPLRPGESFAKLFGVLSHSVPQRLNVLRSHSVSPAVGVPSIVYGTAVLRQSDHEKFFLDSLLTPIRQCRTMWVSRVTNTNTGDREMSRDELKRLEQEAKAWDEEVARAEDRGNEVA